jgi:hypothetical protein
VSASGQRALPLLEAGPIPLDPILLDPTRKVRAVVAVAVGVGVVAAVVVVMVVMVVLVVVVLVVVVAAAVVAVVVACGSGTPLARCCGGQWKQT